MLISERDPKAEGKIIVRDGWQDGPIILEYNIENGTFPQSVTTKTSVMWITLQYTVPSLPPAGVSPTKRCKHLRGCIRLLMELTTDYGMYDYNLIMELNLSYCDYQRKDTTFE